MRNLTLKEMNGCVGGLAKFLKLETGVQSATVAESATYKYTSAASTTPVRRKYSSFAIAKKF